jgi:hypothetical protein
LNNSKQQPPQQETTFAWRGNSNRQLFRDLLFLVLIRGMGYTGTGLLAGTKTQRHGVKELVFVQQQQQQQQHHLDT